MELQNHNCTDRKCSKSEIATDKIVNPKFQYILKIRKLLMTQNGSKPYSLLGILVTNTPDIFFDPVSTGMELIGLKSDDNSFSKVFFMCKFFFLPIHFHKWL